MTVPQNWSQPNPTYYPTPQANQVPLQRAPIARPPTQQLVPTPVLPPQQPTYVHNYRSSMQPRFP